MHATCGEVFDNKYTSTVLNRQHQNHKLLEEVQHTRFSQNLPKLWLHTSLAMTHVSKRFLRCYC